MHTFRLGDEFFLLNHDQLTGKPGISRQILGGGLVAALLGELVMDGRLTITGGRVRVVDGSSHDDPACSFLLESLTDQPAEHPVRTWIENLDEIGYELVARRLVERGAVRREQPRRLLGKRRDQFPAVRREVVEPLLWLESVVRGHDAPDTQRAVLAGLVRVSGTTGALGGNLGATRVDEAITEMTGELPAELTELLAGFDAAVVALPLTTRR